MTQALRNLLDNATRAAPEGSTVRVEIGESSVTVSDAGEGVPEFALPRLTERFYALPDAASGEKGSGLGLAFVRQIMLLHGGSVAFANLHPGFSATLRFPPATQ